MNKNIIEGGGTRMHVLDDFLSSPEEGEED